MQEVTRQLLNAVKSLVDEHEFLDIGKGVEERFPVGKERFRRVISMLEDEGYKVVYIKQSLKENPAKSVTNKYLIKKGIDSKTMFEKIISSYTK